MQNTGLSAEVLSILQKIFENYSNIEQVKLYGSRAKGTFNERSDIDLVVFGKKIDRSLIAEILMDLDESDIPFLVDIQSYHELKNRQLVEHIDRVGVLIFSAS